MPGKGHIDVSDYLEPVLYHLRDNKEKYFSLKELSEKLNLSPTIVRETIGGLSTWGYRFVMDATSNIRFKSAPDAIFPFEIRYGLKTKFLGRKIESHYSVSSTNLIAHNLAAEGASEGTIVISEKQRGGKGRLGRSWHSPQKVGLWFSMVLRPDIDPSNAPSLSILSALTLSEILRSKYKLHSQIKWPNDVLIDGRKATGILTELDAEKGKVNFVVVGIGINVNTLTSKFPANIRKLATSIREEYGEEINRIELLRDFLEKFEKYYNAFCKKGLKPFLARVKKHSLMLGRKVKLKVGRKVIQAEVYDIGEDGALLVKHRKEKLKVTAGEVTVLDAGG